MKSEKWIYDSRMEVRTTSEQIKRMKKIVENDMYRFPTIAQFIRSAIEQKLKEEEGKDEKGTGE